MKTLQIAISITLLSLLPFMGSSQIYYYQTSKGLPDRDITPVKTIKQPNLIDTTNYLLSNYTSDSYFYQGVFMGMQGQLINNSYIYPRDTTGSSRSKTMFHQNYNCINSVAVAFDSLVYDTNTIYPWSLFSFVIDTIYIPIIQVNHSNHPDTLDIQLINVDANGYPLPSSLILDTMVINTNIGIANSHSVNVIKWSLDNYQLQGTTKFAVYMTYYDSTRVDSCWFIYGYGYFTRTCPYEGTDSIFANATHYSKITNSLKPFYANSFEAWNEYKGIAPFFPFTDGNNVFFPCTAADTDEYHPGIDGANYFQDIDISASIQLVQNTGINTINSLGLRVGQNYPNPFTATSTITYSLTQPSDATFSITDLTGRVLIHTYYGTLAPGQYSIVLNGADFQPGVYLYTLTSSGYSVTKKMVVY